MHLAGGYDTHTVLSVAYHTLLPMFTMEEARTLRLVCREFRDTVAAYPWADHCVLRSRVRQWRRSFPLAKVALVANWATPLQPVDFCYLEGLRELDLCACKLTDDVFRHFRGIKTLNVGRTNITGAGFVHLAGIESLTVDDCPVTDDAFRHLPGLRRLSVRATKVTNAAFQHLKSLRSLDVGWCELIRDGAFAGLALEELNINWCTQITDAAFVHFTGLRRLSMIYCRQITPAAFAHLKVITELDIGRCARLDASIFDHIRTVRNLNMMGCTGIHTTPEAMNKGLPVVEILCIDDCTASVKAAAHAMGFRCHLGLRRRIYA